jgi:hypothetical protein
MDVRNYLNDLLFCFISDGCCYNPRNDSINYMVTAYKIDNQGTNVNEFSNYFDRSLTDIRKLIEQNPNKPIKSKL